jgi:hypothetical protein
MNWIGVRDLAHGGSTHVELVTPERMGGRVEERDVVLHEPMLKIGFDQLEFASRPARLQ